MRPADCSKVDGGADTTTSGSETRALSDVEAERSVDAASAYLSALESVISSVCDVTKADDRIGPKRLPPITVLLAEVPLLLEGGLVRRLTWLCDRSPAWGKVALLTMRELIMSKHTRKRVLLSLAISQLLEMQNADLQQSTVRMLANQVYPGLQPDEQQGVEDAAVRLIADYQPEVPGRGMEETPEFIAHRLRLCSNACQLLTSLCTKRSALLGRFCEVYMTAAPLVRTALLDGARQVGAMLNADSPHVVDLVRNQPEGTEDVVVAVLEGVLPKTQGIAPPGLVAACVDLYSTRNDVRVLALAIPGMPPSQALEHVRHLVRLEPSAFDSTMRLLVMVPEGGGDALLSAVDVLIQLHLAKPEDLNVRFESLSTCLCRYCLDTPSVFTF